MSHLSLGNLLNELNRTGQVLVSEGVTSLTVSDVMPEAVLNIARAATEASWRFQIFDREGTDYEPEEVHEDFGSFRIELEKPSVDTGLARSGEPALTADLYVVTEAGFRSFLRKGHVGQRWCVLGLGQSFSSRARAYSEWGEAVEFSKAPATKAPRLLVKESAAVRTVPDDINDWLLAEGQQLDSSNPLHRIWAIQAFDALSRCLANEIDGTGATLTFKGPPKLNLTVSEMEKAGASIQVSLLAAEVVQDAAGWVFDNAREAEVKHILLSAEIARSGRADGVLNQYLVEHLASALDCAKIAYQMSISEITKDTLKSLGDLRKAVTEETSKATDATRQAVAALGTTFTAGLGLIVARVTTQINASLIVIAMIIAFGYALLSVISGRKFVSIQRGLRDEWQPKLYRFLSVDEFRKMVADPIRDAETLFNRVSRWGLVMLGAATFGICVFAFTYDAGESSAQKPATEAVKPSERPMLKAPPPGSGPRSRNDSLPANSVEASYLFLSRSRLNQIQTLSDIHIF
ncbi:hypothetical protein SAMN03159376_01857 [Pseudomonas sp. NFACC09-4]|nr:MULTISPECIES: hypothetical protein [Pseudomonas]NHN68225.1 hypothetical protein [Pseudomonas fluorescens]SFW49068.1 hypothetical protein SAMN03159376_01857 [Pseudomonas sp. NFACC09-4]